eukprot:6588972-Lingulodinium_polyedra.AAC.1
MRASSKHAVPRSRHFARTTPVGPTCCCLLGQPVVPPRVEDSGRDHCDCRLATQGGRNESRFFNARLLAGRCKGVLGCGRGK